MVRKNAKNAIFSINTVLIFLIKKYIKFRNLNPLKVYAAFFSVVPRPARPGLGFFWHGSGLARAHSSRNGPARDQAGPNSGRPKLARAVLGWAEFRPRVNGPGRVGSKSPHNFLTNFKTLFSSKWDFLYTNRKPM